MADSTHGWHSFFRSLLVDTLALPQLTMSLMPAYGFRDYYKLKNAELSQILNQHGLASSGTKERMVARLIQHDEQQ